MTLYACVPSKCVCVCGVYRHDIVFRRTRVWMQLQRLICVGLQLKKVGRT